MHRFVKSLLQRDTATRVKKLQKKIRALRARKSSKWKSYHDGFLVEGKVPERLDDRFERIFALVNEVTPQSILDLAGNAGVFSEVLARRMPNIPVICTDYDWCAIDVLFSRQVKDATPNLSFAVLDFMNPKVNYHIKDQYKRFQSDCVLALAVTHHLLLSQKFTFDEIFGAIGKYASRKVFIEFMPLGLYDGKASPEVPEWYTIESFQSSFEKFFKLEHIEFLEKNRVLFCGTIIKN